MTTLTETIRELREFNEWRRGSEAPMPNPKRVGEAIDAVCDAAERAERYERALTPSAETKATYIGEFGFTVELAGEDGPFNRDFQVPWTTIKEIMKAISKEALAPQTDTAAHKFQDQADEALDAIATRKDAPGAAVSPCKTCGGDGIMPNGGNEWTTRYFCQDCNGTGKESK